MVSGGEAAKDSVILCRKQMIVSSLCKHLSLDPKTFLGNIMENDIKTLCSSILKSSEKTNNLKDNGEVMKWITFTETLPLDSDSSSGVLNGLNEDLSVKSVLLGDGLAPSEADVVVFSVLHFFVIGLSKSERQKLPHVMRWIDWIQNQTDLGGLFEKIMVEKTKFEPQLQSQQPRTVAKVELDLKAKNTMQSTNKATNSEAELASKKNEALKKVGGNNEATQEKKKQVKQANKETTEKEIEVSISLLDIKVGLIRKAWKHPSADSLLVEEIDVGDAKLRQVVSGLAKYCSPDELTNRRVVLITNVKPGKLRDVMSEGLVLCASNEDHTVVEPLIPPEEAIIGERVSFSGYDGKPEDVLNPKKKQLEKITPHLVTDDKGVATFKAAPFMTSAGPCRSSIPKASIK